MAYAPKPQGPVCIDAADLPLFLSRKWYRGLNGYVVGNESTAEARRRGSSKMQTIRLHRIVMNAPDGVWVDHINGDILDCRKANLRFATPQQNSFNSRRAKPKSGYRGVYMKSGLKYAARLTDSTGNYVNLGWFKCPTVAALAYDAAARKHHGEFAVLNFSRVNIS